MQSNNPIVDSNASIMLTSNIWNQIETSDFSSGQSNKFILYYTIFFYFLEKQLTLITADNAHSKKMLKIILAKLGYSDIYSPKLAIIESYSKKLRYDLKKIVS